MSERKRDLVFFLIVLLLSSWHLDNTLGDNTASRAAMVVAIVKDGTLCIDPYESLSQDKALVDGHYYSEKAPLPALLVVPFHWVARATGLIPDGADGEIPKGLVPLSGFICGSVPFACLVFLAYRRMHEAGQLPWSAAVATIAFLGSFIFVQSGTFFGHLPAALCTVLAWFARERERSVSSAAWIGAAVLCEYSLIVFPITWLVQDVVRSRWQVVLRMCIGGLPGVLLLLVLNTAITGDPFTLPYARVAGYGEARGLFGIIAPRWDAMVGLLWGPYRGMLWYAPLTVLAIITVVQRRRSIERWIMHPLVIPSMLLFLMIGAHTMWWGGWAFGPRHITVIAVLVLVAGLPKVRDAAWTRWSIVLLGAFGLFLGIAAKNTVWGALPSDVTEPIGTVLLPALRSGNWTEHQWPVMLGLSPGAASCAFLLIFVSALFLFARSERKPASAHDASVPLP
ncbi:MAG TPA: hypothetical protein PLB89_04060 [Flavobacteriales bacterium]|nr:hypothetical protein [Flavobacteriales bacterium]